jgi:hypothetical protein
MLGHQQPKAQQVARDFIGQELADLPFHAAGVGRLEADSLSGALSGQGRGPVLGVEAVEFFFAGRNRR